MKIKIRFIYFIVFLYAVLIFMMIAAIIKVHLLINDFDMSKHHEEILGKLTNKPELNKYDNQAYTFDFKLIYLDDIDTLNSLTGLGLDDRDIGKYIFRINGTTYVIYDYRRDRIVHIYEANTKKPER